ncbi:MAG: NUDIX hydrolase [bacterium]|nr:NUDIX hydrolase [bacterium]
MSDDQLSPDVDYSMRIDTFALATATYAERADGNILLLQRAEGTAMAGTYFLPGGIVDPGETPWEAAPRELEEETGLKFSDTPQMVGCYPMYLYRRDFLQLTFRGPISGDVVISGEHTDHRWVNPHEWTERFTPENIEAESGGHPKIAMLLEGIGDDLRRYLALIDGPQSTR